MRFEVSEEAAALRDAAAALLAKEVPAAVVRAGWPGQDHDAVRTAWRRLADVGAVATLVTEPDGGLGLDENSIAPLLEEIGRSGLPAPAAETIAVAAPLLAAAGSPQLAGVLEGELTVAAYLGPRADAELIPSAQTAELILLHDGDTLRLFERAELQLEPCATVDGSRGLARLASRPSGGAVLTDDPTAIEAAWQRGVLATSALLNGLSRRMLDMTVEYVKGREQFGVPVGSFQALKHALANALVAVEFARPVALAAGWAQATGAPDAAAQTSSAKVLASDAARLIARTAIQCHGAMGYTTEYDLHLFAKRAWALAASWGDAAWHRARLADVLGL